MCVSMCACINVCVNACILLKSIQNLMKEIINRDSKKLKTNGVFRFSSIPNGKSCLGNRLAYLHLTMAHSQGQDHAHLAYVNVILATYSANVTSAINDKYCFIHLQSRCLQSLPFDLISTSYAKFAIELRTDSEWPQSWSCSCLIKNFQSSGEMA